MKKAFVLIVFFIVLISSVCVYAHKGRTDKYGGHYNRSSGTYHYHSGKYADTGEYTAPIEEGGKKIEDEDVQEETTRTLEITSDEAYYEAKIKELEDKIEKLEKEKEEQETVLEDKDDKIENMQGDVEDAWITSIVLMGISIFIAYNVGHKNGSKK